MLPFLGTQHGIQKQTEGCSLSRSEFFQPEIYVRVRVSVVAVAEEVLPVRTGVEYLRGQARSTEQLGVLLPPRLPRQPLGVCLLATSAEPHGRPLRQLRTEHRN